MGNRKIYLVIICSFVILLTGCWDQVAIEDRDFVIGTSIDMADKQESNNYNLHVTDQIVVPAGLGSGGEGGSSPKAYTNVSANGTSLIETFRKISTATSSIPYYEHLKVIVVSEELAQEPGLLARIMDVFIRDQEMRRSIKVIVSKGDAQQILEIKPDAEKLPAIYIESTIEQVSKSLEIAEPVRIGELQDSLLNQTSYTLPRVLATDNRVMDNGVAVFQGDANKMVGVLNGDETKGLNLVSQSNKGGTIQFEIDNQLMVFDFENTKSKIKIDTKDLKHIKIAISIDVEGFVTEMFDGQTLLTSGRFLEIEKAVEKKTEELAMQTIKKAQKELNTDVFEFDKRLKQRHYKEWKKIKDNWEHGENLFANSTITVSANAIVRSTGVTNKTKSNKE